MNDTPQTSAEAALNATVDYIYETIRITGSERQIIRDAIASNFGPLVRERDDLERANARLREALERIAKGVNPFGGGIESQIAATIATDALTQSRPRPTS